MSSIAIVILLAAVQGGAAEAAETVVEPVRVVMKDLAQELRRMEAGLEKQRVGVARDASQRLRALAHRLAGSDVPGAHQNEDLRHRYAAMLAGLSTQAETALERGELPAAGSAARALRRACIACHVKTRPLEDLSGYPAIGRTAWGVVRLIDRGGEPRASSADVVVFVDQAPEPAWPDFEVEMPVVTQAQMRFSPTVLPVVVGTTVGFPNNDRVFHNVFSLSKAKPFDLGVYGGGRSRQVLFEETGLVRVFCNLHADMSSSVLVLQNSVFAVTDADGFYVLSGVPADPCKLRTWSPLGAVAVYDVELGVEPAARLDMELLETRQEASHLNKFGRPYRSKY